MKVLEKRPLKTSLKLNLFQKNPLASIKIKSALPPPPKKPPQNAEFYGHGFSCRKNAFFQVSIKIGAAISGPRIADTNFTDTRIFLTFEFILVSEVIYSLMRLFLKKRLLMILWVSKP